MVPAMFDRMFSWAPRVADHPRLKGELHRMRIAGKPLRYTMEIGEPCFGDPFRGCFAEIRDLLELLGDVHDLDVAIARLDDHVEEVRIFNRTVEPKKRLRLSAMVGLLKELRREREAKFRRVTATLRRFVRTRFRGRLVRSME